MKKLMIAAAVAAMGAGAFADDDPLCEPVEVKAARVYQVQMNVYTTKGVFQGTSIVGGSVCEPGEEGECLVLRGKDKTVIRGYVYTCANLCALDDYQDAFCDSKRKALFEGAGEQDNKNFTWNLLNFMGSNFADVECNWTFEGTINYGDEARSQKYTLTGSGYGQTTKGVTIFADRLSGYFAGTVSAPYDLRLTYEKSPACVCVPSSVLTCATYDDLEYAANDSVAFGTWKMRFNANVSKAYLAGQWTPLAAIQKAMQ